jgi:hypothetical protein
MADAVGLLASAIVSQVGAKLGSAIGDQVTMLCSFKDDLEDMKETLLSLAEVLKDAERRSIKEMSVRLWLKRLKNAAYDISDMLDQFQEDSKHATVKVYMLTIDHQYFFLSEAKHITITARPFARVLQNCVKRIVADKLCSETSVYFYFHKNEPGST